MIELLGIDMTKSCVWNAAGAHIPELLGCGIAYDQTGAAAAFLAMEL